MSFIGLIDSWLEKVQFHVFCQILILKSDLPSRVGTNKKTPEKNKDPNQTIQWSYTPEN